MTVTTVKGSLLPTRLFLGFLIISTASFGIAGILHLATGQADQLGTGFEALYRVAYPLSLALPAAIAAFAIFSWYSMAAPLIQAGQTLAAGLQALEAPGAKVIAQQFSHHPALHAAWLHYANSLPPSESEAAAVAIEGFDSVIRRSLILEKAAGISGVRWGMILALGWAAFTAILGATVTALDAALWPYTAAALVGCAASAALCFGMERYYTASARDSVNLLLCRLADVVNAELPVLSSTTDKMAAPDASSQDEFLTNGSKNIELHGGKNLTWFNTQRAKDDTQSRFLVLTSGNCGAIWFASALNRHEAVLSGCGVDSAIGSFVLYNLGKSGDELLTRTKQHHFRHGATPGCIDVLRHRGLDFAIPERDMQAMPQFVFDELETANDLGNWATIGNVHGFTAWQFSDAYQRNPSILGNRRVVTTNMIRHPLPRIDSFIRALMHYSAEAHKPAIDKYIADNIDEIRSIEKTYGISMEDPRSRMFLYTFRVLDSVKWVADELKLFRGMKAHKMESLQTDPEYFASAVTMLSSGKITPHSSYLDEVFKPENLGVGRRGATPDGSRPPGAREQWESWPDWEKAEFKSYCQRHQIFDAYAEHDYDFSYIR